MKSAFLLSTSTAIFDEVCSIMRGWGAVADDVNEVVKFENDDGWLLTIFKDAGVGWEYHRGPFTPPRCRAAGPGTGDLLSSAVGRPCSPPACESSPRS
jgi:hypothetical protein